MNASKTKKKTALVICRDGKRFWTTQTQFWQWFRDGIIEKTGDRPLTAVFWRERQELPVLSGKSVPKPRPQKPQHHNARASVVTQSRCLSGGEVEL